MSLDFPAKFGNSAPKAGEKAATTGTRADQPKAQLWLNIGYPVTVKVDGADEERFVSLPLGIPLDTQEHLATNSRNELFAQFQGARNDLLDQIMDAAKALAPGEDRILNLSIQLRRVNEDAAPVSAENNAFVRKLDL
uniref:RNAP1 subunit A n=1 Tax=Pseudomonas phage Arace01 TaxID=3138526 RepID=A0AAU6VZP0_9VIRU